MSKTPKSICVHCGLSITHEGAYGWRDKSGNGACPKQVHEPAPPASTPEKDALLNKAVANKGKPLDVDKLAEWIDTEPTPEPAPSSGPKWIGYPSAPQADDVELGRPDPAPTLSADSQLSCPKCKQPVKRSAISGSGYEQHKCSTPDALLAEFVHVVLAKDATKAAALQDEILERMGEYAAQPEQPEAGMAYLEWALGYLRKFVVITNDGAAYFNGTGPELAGFAQKFHAAEDWLAVFRAETQKESPTETHCPKCGSDRIRIGTYFVNCGTCTSPLPLAQFYKPTQKTGDPDAESL